MNIEEIIIFTDGATPNNQNKGNRIGGVGVFYENNIVGNISYGLIETESNKVTNQICELLACIDGLEKVLTVENIKNKQIIIYTDSMYIVNTITIWAKNWEKNNWTKQNGDIANLSLVQKLYFLANTYNVKFIHVKAHRVEPINKASIEWKLWYGNYMADSLAVSGAKSKY
jgi:ribonuclease HI